MEITSNNKKHISWKAPREVVDILDFLAHEESEPGNPASRSDVLLKIVSSSRIFRDGKKRKEELQPMAQAA